MHGLKNSMLYVLVVFILLSAVKSCCAAEAVADYKMIIQNMPEYSSAKKEYDESISKAQDTLNAEIKSTKNDAEKQQLMNQYAQFCKDERNRLFSPMVEKMKIVLGQIARENGYTKVLSKDSGTAAVDITQQAMQRLNANSKNSGVVSDVKNKVEQKHTKNSSVQPTVQQQAENKVLSGKIEIQFGACNNKNLINSIVVRAQQNGVKSAYVAEAKDNAGKTFWRARARAENMAEAKTLSEKLTKMGLKKFIAT